MGHDAMTARLELGLGLTDGPRVSFGVAIYVRTIAMIEAGPAPGRVERANEIIRRHARNAKPEHAANWRRVLDHLGLDSDP